MEAKASVQQPISRGKARAEERSSGNLIAVAQLQEGDGQRRAAGDHAAIAEPVSSSLGAT